MTAPAHVTLRFTPPRSWPPGTLINVYTDAVLLNNRDYGPNSNPGAAQIVYTTPLNPAPAMVWRDGAKGGQGMGKQGADIQGEGSGGVYAGMGNYPMGQGDLGWGTPYFIWSSRSIGRAFRDGHYFFAIRLVDERGNVASSSLTPVQIVVSTAPRPPYSLAFSSYNSGTFALAFTWGKSLDVEDGVVA